MPAPLFNLSPHAYFGSHAPHRPWPVESSRGRLEIVLCPWTLHVPMTQKTNARLKAARLIPRNHPYSGGEHIVVYRSTYRLFSYLLRSIGLENVRWRWFDAQVIPPRQDRKNGQRGSKKRIRTPLKGNWGNLGIVFANDSLNHNKFCDEDLNLLLPNRSQSLKHGQNVYVIANFGIDIADNVFFIFNHSNLIQAKPGQ